MWFCCLRFKEWRGSWRRGWNRQLSAKYLWSDLLQPWENYCTVTTSRWQSSSMAGINAEWAVHLAQQGLQLEYLPRVWLARWWLPHTWHRTTCSVKHRGRSQLLEGKLNCKQLDCRVSPGYAHCLTRAPPKEHGCLDKAEMSMFSAKAGSEKALGASCCGWDKQLHFGDACSALASVTFQKCAAVGRSGLWKQ